MGYKAPCKWTNEKVLTSPLLLEEDFGRCLFRQRFRAAVLCVCITPDLRLASSRLHNFWVPLRGNVCFRSAFSSLLSASFDWLICMTTARRWNASFTLHDSFFFIFVCVFLFSSWGRVVASNQRQACLWLPRPLIFCLSFLMNLPLCFSKT